MTSQSFTVQVAQRGLITLPQALRKAYDIQPGQELTLTNLDGVFVLSPRASQIDPLADSARPGAGGERRKPGEHVTGAARSAGR